MALPNDERFDFQGIAAALFVGLLAIAGAHYLRPVAGRFTKVGDGMFLDTVTGEVTGVAKGVVYRLQLQTWSSEEVKRIPSTEPKPSVYKPGDIITEDDFADEPDNEGLPR